MAGSQLQGYVVLLLKIVPFLFSIALKGVELNFYDRWWREWSAYKDSTGYTIAAGEEEWRYQEFSVYLHDKQIFRSSLLYALILATALHLLLMIQEGVGVLAIPVALYFIGAALTVPIAESFYRFDPDGRNPDRYENYYYDREDTGTAVKSVYKNRLAGRFDQRLSPPNVSVLIDIIILVNIALLEAVLVLQVSIPFAEAVSIFSNREIFSLIWSLIAITGVSLLIFILFPFNSVET